MTEERQQEHINDVQRLFFELFRRVRYNLLDGERVVRDLLDWHDLWYSVLPTRFPSSFNTQKDKQYHPYTELSMLRTFAGRVGLLIPSTSGPTITALPQLRQRIESAGRPARSRSSPLMQMRKCISQTWMTSMIECCLSGGINQ